MEVAVAPPPPPRTFAVTRAGVVKYDERAVALEQLFEGAGAAGAPRFNVRDRGTRGDVAAGRSEYSMCYRRDIPELRDFCGPDWTFVHWPSAGVAAFERTRDDIVEASRTEPQKPGIAGWIGHVHLREWGQCDEDVNERETRPKLLALSKGELAGKLEVTHVSAKDPPSLRVPMPQLVRTYGILVDIGGIGYSGRLKYLLFSGRPLLLVDRAYVEYFHEDLKPYVHFVPVRADLQDLGERIDWVRAHPEEAAAIAQRASDFARTRFAYASVLKRVREVCERIGCARQVLM